VFDQNHVDSSIRIGKRDGAFCSTLTPKITPFVLVNFTGKSRDVFTLAHELGHAVHSQAAQNRSILVQDAPLPLAETASTFSELLLYDNISNKITSDEKKIMLSEKIDDFYATIMRQSFFTIFEKDAHAKIGQGTTIDEISKRYLANLKEQFGSAVNVSDDFAIEWSYIPHFYHSPFYCYAYSFGNLLALSLFQRYKKEGKDFVPSYISILSAGGSQKPEILLKEYGLNITSSKFWQEGFDYIKTQVKELESLN
jgi:oligoendopeptidase F